MLVYTRFRCINYLLYWIFFVYICIIFGSVLLMLVFSSSFCIIFMISFAIYNIILFYYLKFIPLRSSVNENSSVKKFYFRRIEEYVSKKIKGAFFPSATGSGPGGTRCVHFSN